MSESSTPSDTNSARWINELHEELLLERLRRANTPLASHWIARDRAAQAVDIQARPILISFRELQDLRDRITQLREAADAIWRSTPRHWAEVNRLAAGLVILEGEVASFAPLDETVPYRPRPGSRAQPSGPPAPRRLRCSLAERELRQRGLGSDTRDQPDACDGIAQADLDGGTLSERHRKRMGAARDQQHGEGE